MNVKKLLLLLIAVPLVLLIARVNLYAATVTAIAAGNYPDAVGVNPVTNKIYAMNYSSGTVTVIDGTVIKTLTASGWGSMGITVNGGPSYSPSAIAVNPVTNRIYIAHYSTNNVTVINGATDTVIGSGIYVGTSPMAIAVNADTNKIYVANNVSNSVSVIDGATNSVSAVVSVGSNPRGLAVNPVTNLVYVANYGSNSVSVIDASNNNSVTTVPGIYSNPERIAVNPVTNKIYVGVHNPSNITIINGVDNTATTTTGAPISGFSYAPAIAVNPVTNTIFVADGVNSGKVAAIHGADNSQSTALAVGATPGALAVNPVTNTLYVGNQNSSYISSIDCATWSAATTISGLFGAGWALGINPTTNTVYVPGYLNYAYVNAVQESAVPAVPLATAITPFAGDSTASTVPAFTFVTTTGANWPAVRNVYYQMDSTSGAWQKAAPATVNKYNTTTTSATLTTGPHTIYAFATDGQDSTSVNTGPGASPLVGAMATYTFTVATAPTSYTIDASAAANGSVSPSGTVTAVLGDTQNFTITPSAGFKILDVLVDGFSVGALSSYSFTSIAGNHTISASFVQQATFNTTSEFSIATNPNGVWSYGWMPAGFGTLNLYTSNNGASYWLGNIGGDGTPAVGKNIGSGISYGIPPGWLTLHPGPGAQPSVLRFTAPFSGTIHITGQFLAGDSGYMQVAVRINGQQQWQAGDSGAFDLSPAIAAGDTIDFTVYGSYGSGNTPLDATISYTTTGPGITSTSPVSGASAVVVTSPIKVTFSEDIDPSTLTLSTFLVNNGDVAGTLSYDVPTKTAVFTPTAVLANGATYAVTIKSGTSGLKSLAGSPLTADFIFSFSTETACAPLPSNPVSWWKGEGNANDLIGPNTGTLNNGATYTVGKVGQAFSFDGVDDSFSSTDTGMPSGNSPRSVVFWMQWLGGSGNNAPFIYGAPSASSAFYTIVIGGKLHIGRWGGGDVPGSQSLTAGSWHHVALIHDGTTTRMYVDGVLDAQENRVYDTVLSGTFRMAVGGAGDFYKGAVDELAVYSRALTAAEIMTSYSAGSTGFCAVPVDVTPPVTTASPAAGQLSLPATVTLTSNETANIYSVVEPVATFSAVLQSAFYNGHFYYLIPSQNWSDSEARAQSLGGHLVTVNDDAENTFLYNTFTNNGAIDRGLWIGLNDVAREGNFVWASGEENALFRKWASGGEPNNSGGGENWVYIFQPGDGRRQFWNDGPNTANPFGAPLYGVVEVVPTLYSGPIPLSEAATVKYFAVDSAGNQEAVQSVTYSALLPVADTTAPTGSVAINPAATYTNLSTINLTLSCKDTGSGCSQMQFSNDGTNWSAPEAVATTKSGWVVSANDGLKTVSVKFQDVAGNWSTPSSTTIILDTTPPAPSVSGDRSVFTIASGLMDPRGIVVDADGVYFGEAGSNNDVVNYSNTDGKIRRVGKYGGVISTLATGLTYPAVVASDTTNVYWSYSDGTNSGSFLKSIAKVGGAMTTLVAGMNGSLMNAAVDAANVYWLETGTGSAGWSSTNDSAVNKIAKDGTGTKVSLVSNVRIGYGSLTIDSSYVYWAGYMGHNVGRIGLDGSSPVILATGDYPTTIAVDASSVYWLTGGGAISKMNKDGSGRQTLATAPYWQNGPLVIDDTNVYWMEYGTTLRTIPKTGGAATTLLSGLPGVGVVADATGIYWSERGTLANNYRDGSIKKLGYPSAVTINSGAATTNSQAVTLTFSVLDANGVSQMQFSNDGTTYDAPITYATSTAWNLAAGGGLKTVYVKFQDVAGNWSAPYSSSVTLVTLDKASSNVTTWPTAGSITYGQTLASSTLSGGVSTPTGTFAFTTPTTAPAAGTETQSVTFTPSDAANYTSATSTVSVTVTQATQGITFGSAPALTSGGASATVSAAATSGLPVIFTSLTGGVCTVSGSTVTPLSAGTCTIAADQAGNSSFAAAPQATQSFAVAPAAAPVADIIIPVITDFTTPASSTTRTVAVSSLTATDAVGVTGYLLSESAIPPRATDSGWTEAAPPEYLSSTWGNKTIYAYAKDAAGNIAVARSATVYIGFTPGVDGVIVSAAADAPVKIEPLLADAYKSLKFAMKLEIPTAEEVVHGRVAPLVNGVPKPDTSRTELNLGDTIVILRRVVGL